MEYKCSKTYKFEYAHQLYTSYTKLCHETIHGHSGKVEIEFQRDEEVTDDVLNKDYMVIDFGEISSIIKSHIMDKYDHALFMPAMLDKDYLKTLKKFNKRLTITTCNPTAEYFSMCIWNECTIILKEKGIPVKITQVKFWETESGCAIYKP